MTSTEWNLYIEEVYRRVNEERELTEYEQGE